MSKRFTTGYFSEGVDTMVLAIIAIILAVVAFFAFINDAALPGMLFSILATLVAAAAWIF